MGFYGDAFLRLTMLRPREIDPWLPQGATHARTGSCIYSSMYGRWSSAHDAVRFEDYAGENQRGAIAASTTLLIAGRQSMSVSLAVQAWVEPLEKCSVCA